jgi:hypothetical protein
MVTSSGLIKSLISSSDCNISIGSEESNRDPNSNSNTKNVRIELIKNSPHRYFLKESKGIKYLTDPSKSPRAIGISCLTGDSLVIGNEKSFPLNSDHSGFEISCQNL